MPLPELPELEELYRLYRTDLYRYLCHLTHDPAEAEDLLSETFLRALKRLHTYRGDCAVKTWLFGIARNIWLEGLRKRHPTASTAANSRMRMRIFVFCCGVIGRIAPAPFPIEQPMSVPLAKC